MMVHRSMPSLLSAALLGVGWLQPVAGTEPVKIDQGPAWSEALRNGFYKVDQGSRMIPYAWLAALRQRDGKLFLEGALTRYGYLAFSPSDDLPVGFTRSATPDGSIVGMTCAACHTRELSVGSTTYRIDGGPAFADFAALLSDLDEAAGRTLADDDRFAAFAKVVLGSSGSDQASASLKASVALWQRRFHGWIARSLPKGRTWGPARLDAITMIFNRLGGLDLGSPPDFVIEDNIHVADAPTRYPFLWNSPRQDFTQWTGFTENGNEQLALARNLGQLFGVFGAFHPHASPASAPTTARDYLGENSANIAGLAGAEAMIRRLGPPVWPWPLDKNLALKGKAVFARPVTDGGCAACHAAGPGMPRPPQTDTLRTPILDVGTDTRQWRILVRPMATGSLEGSAVAGSDAPLRSQEPALTVLRAVVVGTLTQLQAAARPASPPQAEMPKPMMMAMQGVMRMQMAAPASPVPRFNAYEARSLEGIWAAAPYLHNGSVPTLADLLLPVGERPASFAVGQAYDIGKVGLATDQPGSTFTLRTTDCTDPASGDSRCGHDYGTQLGRDDQRALLEYLKSL